MDKEVAKQVLGASGIDVPRGVVVTGTTKSDLEAARSVGLPAFVKPVSSGSSVGASIASREGDLAPAITLALKYDRRVLIEELIKGRELTVPVIGNDDLTALPVIEILTERAFFDYSAKYDAGESEEVCPADIPVVVAKRAQDLALRAHRALHCRGMSRADFVWSGDRMVTLEVNTIPGMTANSLLPKAARAGGCAELPAPLASAAAATATPRRRPRSRRRRAHCRGVRRGDRRGGARSLLADPRRLDRRSASRRRRCGRGRKRTGGRAGLHRERVARTRSRRPLARGARRSRRDPHTRSSARPAH
jgi:hypothetical protein